MGGEPAPGGSREAPGRPRERGARDRQPDDPTQSRPRALRDDRRVLHGAAPRVRRVPPRGGGLMARHPGTVPMLAYEDGLAAMDWLARAVRLRQTMRRLTKDGRLAHGGTEARASG